jgi:hypothetical protein
LADGRLGTRIARVRALQDLKRVCNTIKEAQMSEQNRYRGSMTQRGQNYSGESQWQRDYGQRTQRPEQRFDSVGRSDPRAAGYGRDYGLERDLRESDYGRDEGYARDDRFPLDFGPTDDREFRSQSRDPRGAGGYYSGRYSQPDSRQYFDNFGSRPRAEANRPSGLQAASFYGRGPKGYARSDERIREDVCERLSDNDEVDASDIEVTVREREVTLEGSVETRRMKHIAEDLADSVSGVDDVHNRLTVRKAFLKDVADRVFGNEHEEHHAHSGTKTTPATSSGAAPDSGKRTANGQI